MVLEIAILLFQLPGVSHIQNSNYPVAAPSATSSSASATPNAKPALVASATPLGEEPTAVTATDSLSLPSTAGGSLILGTVPNIYLPPPAAAFRPINEPAVRRSRLWFALSVAQHGSAAFDAWSTRNAISQGRVEADPFMRPFANSAAIYGAIQVIPIGLDYLARRMQRGTGWTRHVWWVPQSVAAATFLFSGSYNVAHTP